MNGIQIQSPPVIRGAFLIATKISNLTISLYFFHFVYRNKIKIIINRIFPILDFLLCHCLLIILAAITNY